MRPARRVAQPARVDRTRARGRAAGHELSPYSDRIVAWPGFEAELAKRTLTNLYNQRPAWLANAHATLDAAVAAACGWADYTPAMPDDEVLRRLLTLNRERAARS